MPAAVQRQGEESSDAQTPLYKGQTLTAETHLFHDHIFTCPKPATVAAPDAPADPKDTEAAESEPGRAAGPRHPPGSPQSPRNAPHRGGIRVAWFLSRRSTRTLQHAGGRTKVSPPRPCPSFRGWNWPWTRSCWEGEPRSIC